LGRNRRKRSGLSDNPCSKPQWSLPMLPKSGAYQSQPMLLQESFFTFSTIYPHA
jgi:hypothetical protein